MQKKDKTLAFSIAMILVLSMAASTMLVPNVNAHSPPWTIISYAYLTVAPSPVGVGQTVAVYMWVDTALPGAVITNDIRRHDYSLTITNPNGKVETNNFPVISDTTGIQAFRFTPTQAGDYTFSFNYAGQTYIWTSSTPGANVAYTGDIFTAANATQTLTVQQEPVIEPSNPPLPTEYWTYPIEGQNYDWYLVASNWLSTPFIRGANPSFGIPGGIQPSGSAPNSAHIMWTKPIQYGGVVGGNATNIPGEAFYQGGSYNTRFNNPIIMEGTLFYQEPYGNSGTGGDYVSVNLQTGQEQWRINASATGTNLVPSFGYLVSHDQPNQHGVLSGILMAASGSTWRAYDARTGVLTTMNITNVPGGSNVAGPGGEYLKFILTNYGNSSNPNWYLAQWNSSKVFGLYTGTGLSNWYSGNIAANSTSAYDWNVSVNLSPGAWSIGSADSGAGPLIDLGNMALLTQGSFGGHVGDFGASITTDPGNITAISLNLQTLGNVLWKQTYQPAPDNNTRKIVGWDPTNAVFVFEDKETMTHSGYSLSDGNLLWGPVGVPKGTSTDWNYLSLSQDQIVYGNLYWFGYTGLLYCYDVKTGDLKWTYGNGGAGNSTYAGTLTPYGYYPIFISAIAEGKIYLITSEHSPNSPLYRGAKLRCINATTGGELWTIDNFGNCMYGGTSPIASGYLVTDNTYNQQIYCYGRGPSQLTVTAPQVSVELGRSLVVSGMITDIAAGTKQDEQAARFPNGVPVVSDESMTGWMEYVYMQKPKPTDVKGVLLTLSVIDANGNFREIGTTTSNSDGSFALKWTPDIEGAYTVYATFAGSNSYWPSHAAAFFAVDPAAPTPAPTQTPGQSAADIYFVPAVAAIIIVIIIGFAVLALLMLRKRP